MQFAKYVGGARNRHWILAQPRFRPPSDELTRIAELIAAGDVRVEMADVVPLTKIQRCGVHLSSSPSSAPATSARA